MLPTETTEMLALVCGYWPDWASRSTSVQTDHMRSWLAARDKAAAEQAIRNAYDAEKMVPRNGPQPLIAKHYRIVSEASRGSAAAWTHDIDDAKAEAEQAREEAEVLADICSRPRQAVIDACQACRAHFRREGAPTYLDGDDAQELKARNESDDPADWTHAQRCWVTAWMDAGNRVPQEVEA